MVIINDKIVFVTDSIKGKQFIISAALLIAPKTNDRDLKHDTENIQAFSGQEESTKVPVEIIKQSNPVKTYTKCEETIRNEISGIIEKEAFKYVTSEKLPPNANFPGERCVLALKQQRTEAERFNAIFIGEGHTETKKKYIIQISETVGHKNIKLLISIAIIYKLKLYNQDVSQAYLQGNDLEVDVM